MNQNIKLESFQIETLPKIFISAKNPRFEKLASVKDNLCEILIEDLDKINQQKIAENLLKREGDLSELYDLINNIYTNGFDGSSEIIFLQNDNNDYIVAEGNRRILCLKLFLNAIEFPKLNFFEKNNNIYENVPQKDEYDIHKIKAKAKIGNNYSKILKIIESVRRDIASFKENNRSFFAIITSNNEYLWKRIHSKHVNGEAVGLRNWSRGQHYINILNYFKNGMNLSKNDEQLYSSRLSKKIDIIKSDYRHAQLAWEIAISDTNNNTYWAREFLIESKVSALQKTFWTRILRLISLEEFGIDWDSREEEFIKIYYDNKNHKMYMEKDKIKNDFLKFIKKWFLKGFLITRQNRKGHDEYNLFIEDLSALLGVKSYFKEDKYQKFINLQLNTKHLVESFLKKLMQLEKWIFAKRFIDLLKQLKHNNKISTYIHAVACTMRSIVEFLIIFNVISISDEKIKDFKFLFKKIFNSKLEKEFFNKQIIKEQDRLIFALFKEEYKTDNLMNKFKAYGKSSKEIQEKLQVIFEFLIKDKNIAANLWSKWINRQKLNNIIHRLYFDDTSLDYLFCLNETIKNLTDALDYDKFKKLNEKIKEVGKIYHSQ